MDIRKDLVGKAPKIGDTIAFNPAKYKGLFIGKIIAFAKSGLPEVSTEKHIGQTNNSGNYTPKTGFVIIED